jgi:hypothetical protein
VTGLPVFLKDLLRSASLAAQLQYRVRREYLIDRTNNLEESDDKRRHVRTKGIRCALQDCSGK